MIQGLGFGIMAQAEDSLFYLKQVSCIGSGTPNVLQSPGPESLLPSYLCSNLQPHKWHINAARLLLTLMACVQLEVIYRFHLKTQLLRQILNFK